MEVWGGLLSYYIKYAGKIGGDSARRKERDSGGRNLSVALLKIILANKDTFLNKKCPFFALIFFLK